MAAIAIAGGAVFVHDVLLPSGGVPASAAGGGPAPEVRSVVAQPGDSLWVLAAQYRGATPIGEYVDTLIELNGGPSIQAGQRVVMP